MKKIIITILNPGLYCEPLKLLLSKNDNDIIINIATKIKITPRSLLGIDLKIA